MKNYKSVLDFVEDVTLTNNEFEKKFSPISNEIELMNEDIMRIPSLGLDEIEDSFDLEFEEKINFNKDELVSYLWFLALETKFLIKVIENKYNIRLNSNNNYFTQLVPQKKMEKPEYSLVLFHENYIHQEYEILELQNEMKDGILAEISKNNFKNRVINNATRRALEFIDLLDHSTLSYWFFYFEFKIIVMQCPELEFQSYHPIDMLKVKRIGEEEVYKSCVGVIARDSSGDLGCTICYHEFMNDVNFTLGSNILVGTHLAKVKNIDQVNDSCFVVFIDQTLELVLEENEGALADLSPQQNIEYSFVGLNNKLKKTIVTGWDPSIPFVKPKIGLINMQKVYTTATTQRGDSGAALIDNNNKVVGFAAYRTGIGAKVPFSVWVWAEGVYFAHKLI